MGVWYNRGVITPPNLEIFKIRNLEFSKFGHAKVNTKNWRFFCLWTDFHEILYFCDPTETDYDYYFGFEKFQNLGEL